MKIFSILSAVILLFTSCNGNKHIFTLEGEINGLTEAQALVLIPDTAHSRIDTIHIKNNRFSYTLHTDTTTLLTLLFPNRKVCAVFADKNTQTQISADTSRWDQLKLKGGEDNNALQLFNDSLNGKSSKEIQAAVKEFIRQHPFSPVGAYLLNKHYAQTPEPDYNAIKECIDLMSGKLQDNFLVKDLQKDLEMVQKADSGKYIGSFRIKNKENKYLNAYQYSGKYLIVSFWASWQPEGKNIQKEILKIQKKKNDKVAFINVALDTDKNAWNEMQKNDTLPNEQACDFEGWNGQMAKTFGITEIPMTVLLTPQRKIALKSKQLNEITSTLDTLLKKDRERELQRRRK